MDDLSLDELAKVANSYRLNHETENAEIWYSQVVEKSSDPIHFLYYAQALQNNGKLDEAKDFYLKYNGMMGENSDDDRGARLAEAIDRVKEFKLPGVTVKNEEILNTESLDFSPTYCKDGIVFVSSRKGKVTEDGKDKWIDDNFMSLFCSDWDENHLLKEPELFTYNLNTRYHEGPVVFNKTGNKIYFTRNHFNKGKRTNNSKGVMKQQIYSSTKEGDGWSEPVELSFNTKEYEEVHPALSPDQRKLYFSSDRPGGYGGMDLYVVEKRGNNWGIPQNLGANINTKGNEVFPFVHEDGTLYFASNGWEGLGGLDIYSTQLIGDSLWLKPHNIGDPINSSMDDFGYIINETKTEGFFTSAREKGFGQDDIYSFRQSAGIVKNPKSPIIICTYVLGTETRIEGTKVTVREVNEDGEISDLEDDFVMRLVETERSNEYILKLKKQMDENLDNSTPTYTTNEKGEFSMEVIPGKTYLFEAEKDGYIIAKEEKTFEEVFLSESQYCIPLEPTNCLTLRGRSMNEKFPTKYIPNTTITLVNLCTGEEEVITSDRNGDYSFPCLECDCDYVLKGEKTNFSPGVAQASTVGKDCSKGGFVEQDVLLNPANIDDILFASYKEEGKPLPEGYRKRKLKVGEVLELRNIYYDFDQYYIRDDARPDLDKVFNLLKAYPTLVVELSSHTDARAPHSYNDKLSQNRAEAAKDYIIKRGISPHRIIAKGYGENRLRNRCKNDMKCTEEEHQYNRRTEVKILEHHEDGLEIQYIDNDPEKIDPADPSRRWRW